MQFAKRLLPGFAVLVAACLGYLYGLQDHLVIPPADPPSVQIVQSGPIKPSPSVSQLEQAAYQFEHQLDEIRGQLETVIAALPPPAMPKPPPVPITWPYTWITVVERADCAAGGGA